MTMKPYQNELPAGATVVAWDDKWLIWKQANPPFPNDPYNCHEVNGKRITGNGHYDLSRTAAHDLTGLPL